MAEENGAVGARDAKSLGQGEAIQRRIQRFAGAPDPIEQAREIRRSERHALDGAERLADRLALPELRDPGLHVPQEGEIPAEHPECKGDLAVRSQAARHVDRLLGTVPGRLVVAGEHQDAGLLREGPRQVQGRRIGRHCREGLADRGCGLLALARPPQVPAVAVLSSAIRSRSPIGTSATRARCASATACDGSLVRTAHSAPRSQDLGQVAPFDLIREPEPFEHRARTFPESLRLGECVHPFRSGGGPDREREGPCRLMCQVPVASDLNVRYRLIARRQPRLERSRKRRVQRRTFAIHELAIDHFVEECVTKGEDGTVRRVAADEDAAVHRLAERSRESRGARSSPAPRSFVVPRAGRLPRPLEGRRGRPARVGHAGPQDVPKHGWEPGPCDRLGKDELFDVERIAVRSREQPVDGAWRGRLVEERGSLLRHLIAIERQDSPAARRCPPAPARRGTRVADRVAAASVRDREDEQHAVVAQGPRQESDQVARRAVGPVDVLDHDDERVLRGHPFQHAQDQLEELRL